ncbi:hypothetical protein HYU50_02825 [Candidatus Woesearchaeota archaeon]|nr:hypothetical protein [Candidatus Woesearchaeota archaeon]
MRFQDFIEQGKARKGSPDVSKVKSLLETSNNHLLFLENQKINEVSAGSILTTYYEALREIVEAICLKEGFKVYSHEAFTYFLKEKNEDIIAIKFDNLRKLRNSINYYGEKISYKEAEYAKEEALKLIRLLKNAYLKGF